MFLSIRRLRERGEIMRKEKSARRYKKPGKLKDLAVKAKQTGSVKGGADQIVHKHIAGVKYE